MKISDVENNPEYKLINLRIVNEGRCIDCDTHITIADYTYKNLNTQEEKTFTHVRDKCACDPDYDLFEGLKG